MVKRKIIKIDEKKCDGCGACIPNCPEGALQLIDGKARIVSDLYCDGLGACIGECPKGAISIEQREAQPYSEEKVMKNIVKAGKNTLIAHLNHLKAHGEEDLLRQAKQYLKKNGIEIPQEFSRIDKSEEETMVCPGARIVDGRPQEKIASLEQTSQLDQWPVQLHLLPANAPFFKSADVVLAADCVAYAVGNFHAKFLSKKKLAIACPKLDSNLESYIEKIRAMIDEAKINTLTVVMMEVPCCRGLLLIAQKALEKASRKIPIKTIIVDIKGNILKDDWC